MMSMKCKYAIKALVYLGKQYKSGLVLTSDIAVKANIPKKFLEHILIELKSARIVNSKQGARGGYYLLKKPIDISVADVYRLFDGAISLTPCASLNFYEKCSDCKGDKTCDLQTEFIKIREGARVVMSRTSIQSFITHSKKRKYA